MMLAMRPLAGARGFTLVELVMVITLLGVLSIAFFQRVATPDAFSPRIRLDEVRFALRHVQRLAIERGCPIRVLTDQNGLFAWHDRHCGLRDEPSYDIPVLLSATGESLTIDGPLPTHELIVDPLGGMRAPGAEGADRLSFEVGHRSLVIHAETGHVE